MSRKIYLISFSILLSIPSVAAVDYAKFKKPDSVVKSEEPAKPVKPAESSDGSAYVPSTATITAVTGSGVSLILGEISAQVSTPERAPKVRLASIGVVLLIMAAFFCF